MKNSRFDDRGFVVVLLAAGLLVLICGFAGLAIDVGRAYYVKGEVQNAADAAAFAGASGLFANPPLATDPNFDAAKVLATEFVQKNQAAGATLTAANAQIEAGYWDLDAKQMRSVPVYLCAGTVNSCTPSAPTPGCACQQRGVAAVRVTVQKPELTTHFAKILGWSSTAPAAMSIAGRGYPTSASVGFPFAITKCMIDYYMKYSLYGQEIKIPDDFAQVPNCDTGNWSSLGLLDNSNDSDKDILTGKTAPVPVTIGEQIMFQEGTRTDLYLLIESNFKGRTVVVPVVAANVLDPNTTSTVTGFMELTITDVVPTARDKYIVGKFVRYYEDGNPSVGGIGGTPSNTLSPPTLLK